MTTNYWIESRPVDGWDFCGDFAACVDLGPYRHAVIVGDIAGHGPGAGESGRALCEYVRHQIARRVPLTETLRAASDFFTRIVMNDPMPFATLFVAVADLREGTVEYASAGHEPALLFHGERGAHDHLHPTGPVLGLGPAHAFGERILTLGRDSVLVVVTDGITEARRRVGDRYSFFGSAGVARAFRDASRQQRDPAHEIYNGASEYADGGLSDDACVVVSSLSFPNRVHVRTGHTNGSNGLRLLHGAGHSSAV